VSWRVEARLRWGLSAEGGDVEGFEEVGDASFDVVSDGADGGEVLAGGVVAVREMTIVQDELGSNQDNAAPVRCCWTSPRATTALT
jgi:hypothetical protein